MPARPALWQKAHPDFQNQDVRDILLREMADELSVTVSEVKERLKTLKDAMRRHVNSLPKTKSGAPAFDKSSQITWAYFTKLLFMKDEFIGRKMTSSHPGDAQCSGRDYDDKSFDDTNDQLEENDEEDVVEQALQASGIPSVGSRCPSEASTSSASAASQSKRKRYKTACYDSIEQEKLNLLKESFAISRQKMEETKDPLEVFVMDLANDLKQIEDRRLLIQTKLELKQVTSKALLKQIDTSCVQGASDVQETY